VEPFAPDVHLHRQYLLWPDMRGGPAVPVPPRGSLAHRKWVWVNLIQSLARLRFSLRKNLHLAVLIDSPGFHESGSKLAGIFYIHRMPDRCFNGIAGQRSKIFLELCREMSLNERLSADAIAIAAEAKRAEMQRQTCQLQNPGIQDPAFVSVSVVCVYVRHAGSLWWN
jgi:hypothetical protein